MVGPVVFFRPPPEHRHFYKDRPANAATDENVLHALNGGVIAALAHYSDLYSGLLSHRQATVTVFDGCCDRFFCDHMDACARRGFNERHSLGVMRADREDVDRLRIEHFAQVRIGPDSELCR
jgi:hypothetical protein